MRLKVLVLLVLGFGLLFLLPTRTLAANNFDISASDVYKIANDGKTQVASNVTITNKTKYTYTPTYTVGLLFSDIADLKATNSAGLLKSQIIKSPTGSIVQITFTKKNIGIGNKNSFIISYSTHQVAKEKKTGWEVVIPGLADPKMFSKYNVAISVPAGFGYAAIVTPVQKSEENHTYKFEINDFSKSGVYMLFKKDSGEPKEKISAKFPKNALFLLPLRGEITIVNSTGETIKNKTLDLEADPPLQSVAYQIPKIKPYESVVVPADLGSAPILTNKLIKVKISFDGNEITSEVNVGFLPDYYILLLGAIIFGGSLLVAIVTVKTFKSLSKR